MLMSGIPLDTRFMYAVFILSSPYMFLVSFSTSRRAVPDMLYVNAICRIFSHSSPKSIPAAAASCGSREVGVMPGNVLPSRQ